MQPRARSIALAVGAVGLLAALFPAIAQKSPQSILPPGFGEPDAPPPPAEPEPVNAPSRSPKPIADEQRGTPFG